jgi:uncharacterized protein YjbJ (UPF0337 family)
MNKDQMKGKAKDLAGNAQKKAGDMTDNKEQQAKGMANQAEGKTQEKLGDAKSAFKKATNDDTQ